MADYLRAYRADDSGDDDVMSFVASTEGVKRDGLEINQANWDLENYRRNDVVLWAHQYDQLPLGRADVRVDDGKLMAEVTWDTEDETARTVARKYRDGFLNAVSVGWSDREDEDGNVTHELLDISAVPVPGDPDALAERQRSALGDMARTILSDVDPENDTLVATVLEDGTVVDAEPRWDDTAAAMVDALTPRSDESEDDRRSRYDALLPAYRHAGKEPPEWLSDAEVYLLGVDSPEWRGLFLEGEVATPGEGGQERVGAVLSARNKADLSEAQRLIQRVLDAATKPDDKDEDERDALGEFARLIGVENE